MRNNLLEGGLLVIAVLFLFLGDLRAGLIVASAIPLAMLIAFTGMMQVGLSGNLMSLGAIDFGLLVDGSVVMIDNILRRLALTPVRNREERLAQVLAAGREVLRPMTLAVGIIILVYVPILALTGIEGKMFRPDGVDGDHGPGRLVAVRRDGHAAAGILVRAGRAAAGRDASHAHASKFLCSLPSMGDGAAGLARRWSPWPSSASVWWLAPAWH